MLLPPSNQNFLFASTASDVVGSGSSQKESTSSMPGIARAYRLGG
jgi:hypothetical protein